MASTINKGEDVLNKPVVQAFVAIAHKRSFPPKHTIVHAGAEPETLFARRFSYSR